MSLYLGYVQSLFRRGGSFGPRPTLDLNFMGGSLGSQVTFSRGTKAMRYGSDGTLQYGPHNLLLHSEDFTNALWLKGQAGVGFVPTVTANQGIAPNGTLTADRVDFNCVGNTNTDRSLMYQAVTSTSGTPYASSYYIKAFDLASVGKTIRYTVETGASSNQVIITLTSEWQRVSNIFPAAGAGYNAILETRGTVTSSTTASVLLWGAQVSEGSIPGEYQATTTAAVYGPRFDYNPSSLVAQNLLLQSQTFSSGSWTKQTGTTVTGVLVTAPNSTLTGQQISWGATATGQGILQAGITVDRTTTNTKSIYVRADAAGGTVEIADPATTIGTSLLTLSTSWQRVSLTETQVGGSAGLWLRKTASSPATIYIWGAQLNTGSTALTYTETTTAPYTLCALKGLLIEEQRTNLMLPSDGTTGWAASPALSLTATANSIASPDGTINATKLATGDLTSSGHIWYKVYTGAISTPYVGSVYLKAGEYTRAQVSFGNTGFAATTGALFDLSNGTIVVTSGGSTASITAVSNGWYRCVVTATSAAVVGNYVFEASPKPASVTSIDALFTPASVGLGAYVYGIQVESGTFVTSLMPTVGSTVTRTADKASVDTLTPWFNATEGSLYVEFSCPAYEPTLYPAATQIGIKLGGSRGYLHVVNGPAATTSFNIFDDVPSYQGPAGSPAYTTGAVRKQIGAYAANNSASSIDGSTPINDTLVTLPTGLNCLAIGTYSILGDSRGGTMHVRQIKYYPTRIANNVLQKLST